MTARRENLPDGKKLERLVHTDLGDWTCEQGAAVSTGMDGADTRITANKKLKHRLELDLDPEKPNETLVRWEPDAEQIIGWIPNENDGVR